MIFGKSRLELKVGIFVFIGLIILLTFVLLIGNFKTLAISQRIGFLFNFINGVKVGAPIRFAGMDVGEIKELKCLFSPEEQKTKVRMVGWVRNDIKIPPDSTVWINTLGLLGEKYVEIMPGKDYTHLVKKNHTFIGNDPVAMHEFGILLKNIVTDMDEAVVKMKNKEGTLGKLMYDDALYNVLFSIGKELKISVATISQEFEGLLTDIRRHPWKLFFKTKEKAPKK